MDLLPCLRAGGYRIDDFGHIQVPRQHLQGSGVLARISRHCFVYGISLRRKTNAALLRWRGARAWLRLRLQPEQIAETITITIYIAERHPAAFHGAALLSL